MIGLVEPPRGLQAAAVNESRPTGRISSDTDRLEKLTRAVEEMTICVVNELDRLTGSKPATPGSPQPGVEALRADLDRLSQAVEKHGSALGVLAGELERLRAI